MEHDFLTKHLIVTAGAHYLDIDAYACMVAMTADGTKLGEAGGSDVAEFAKEWKKMLVCAL